jgi:transposase
VTPSLIYRWRRDLRAEAGFAQVIVATNDMPLAAPGPPIEIEFAGSVRVRVPTSTPPALAAAIVEALARR